MEDNRGGIFEYSQIRAKGRVSKQVNMKSKGSLERTEIQMSTKHR